MTKIFIDITILLNHRSQVAKCVFLRYHLTIESMEFRFMNFAYIFRNISHISCPVNYAIYVEEQCTRDMCHLSISEDIGSKNS
jgi:hypothetical protein